MTIFSNKNLSYHYHQIRSFVGPTVLPFCFLSVILGVSLFAVEFCFAFALQGFLVGIGVVSREVATLPPWFPTEPLYMVLLALFGVGTFRAALQGTQVYISTRAYENQKHHQRANLVRWAFNCQSVNSSEVVSRYNNEIGAVSNMITQGLSIIVLFTSTLLTWVGLFFIAKIPTLIVTAFLLLIGLSLSFLDKQIKRSGVEVGHLGARINERMFQGIKNLLLIQIYNTQEQENSAVQKDIKSLNQILVSYQKVISYKNFLPQTMGLMLVCLITLYVQKSYRLPASLLISYFYLIGRFVQNFSEMLRASSLMKFIYPQANLMYTWWTKRARGELESVGSRIKKQVVPWPGFNSPVGWVLKNLSYTYPGTQRAVLNDLSLEIKPGNLAVVIGPSGVGKSTLMQILLSLFVPTGGEIKVISEGKEIGTPDEVHGNLLRSVGYVGPESFLIEGTVRENLVYGLPLNFAVTDAKIKQALEFAEAQFVFSMPRGLDHFITEQGQGLSAGQKQRLSLARALLREPKILVLDEATSNLDYATEARLVETFRHLKGQMTIVAVTHRETILPVADQVIKL